MTASELDGWVDFYAIEPFGVLRDNLHAGILASIVANALRPKGRPSVAPSDFILVTATERRNRSLADGLRRLRQLATGVKQ